MGAEMPAVTTYVNASTALRRLRRVLLRGAAPVTPRRRRAPPREKARREGRAATRRAVAGSPAPFSVARRGAGRPERAAYLWKGRAVVIDRCARGSRK